MLVNKLTFIRLFNASHFMKLLTLGKTNKFVLLSLNRNFSR